MSMNTPIEELREAVASITYYAGVNDDTRDALETLRSYLDTLDGDWQPLTDDTPRGTYWWCQGDGTVCRVLQYMVDSGVAGIADGLAYETFRLRTRSNYFKSGYVRPYDPPPGPVLPRPIQGEKPVMGVVTIPDGKRHRAAKIGQWVSYGNGWIFNDSKPPAGYTFTPDESYQIKESQ